MCGRAGLLIGPTNCPSAQPLGGPTSGHRKLALASQQCKKNNTVQRLVSVITLVATASNNFVRDCRSHATAADGLVLTQRKNKKGPLTYGPKSDEEWSQAIIHQEVNGPTSGEEWSNTYANIDTNPPIDRQVGHSRSISTVGSISPTGEHAVYIDCWFDSTYGEFGRSSMSINDQDNFVIDTARSREDKTRNARRNATRKPEW